jgi:hypothetical protein
LCLGRLSYMMSEKTRDHVKQEEVLTRESDERRKLEYPDKLWVS